jgi:hypothetical protein
VDAECASLREARDESERLRDLAEEATKAQAGLNAVQTIPPGVANTRPGVSNTLLGVSNTRSGVS